MMWYQFLQRLQQQYQVSEGEIIHIHPDLTLSLQQIQSFIGVAIAAILGDTVKRENPQELIYWNDENICKAANRDPKDNVAQVFLPQLVNVKKSMISLQKEADLDICNTWIKVIF